MDRVIFRKWDSDYVSKCGHTDDIIAILPDVEVEHGYHMMYEHVGQHGEGDYAHVVSKTVLAKTHEYQELLAELISMGYELRVVKRLTNF